MPDTSTSRPAVPARTPERIIDQAQQRIALIRQSLQGIDYVCTGSLLERMKVCGKPNCRCAQDPDARHGPYFVWGRLKAGKLVQQTLLPEQAALLRRAIANHRKVKKLLHTWEAETERVINAQHPG